MTAAILRRSPTEFETPERCFILELFSTPDDGRVSVSQARVRPGVTTQWHSLTGTDERYVITAGIGIVEVGDDLRAPVGAGDVVLIPAGRRQRITNTGATDLLILCICTPRFQPACYVAEE
jgi:mannose-6-phosphate isomerase-like protein (cupin superfamily)